MDRAVARKRFVERRARELMDAGRRRALLEIMDRRGLPDADFYRAACEMQFLEREAAIDAEIEAVEIFGEERNGEDA